MEPSCPIYFKEEGMDFKVTYTIHETTVEEWIHLVKENFLDAAPVKCVGLDCEYTDTVGKARRMTLAPEELQRAAVLQLSVAYETLVFQICRADAVPDLLRQFLMDD